METNPIINVNVQSNDTPSAQYKTVILKPNMVDDVNTLTQAMVNQANTKYVIKYNFTLGENITVPANCVLEFDGGSISASGSNDTITGNNTGINAGLVKIFNTDITLAGSWNVVEAYPEWFGAKGDNNTDDADAIQKTCNSFICCPIYFTNIYRISKTINLNRWNYIRGSVTYWHPNNTNIPKIVYTASSGAAISTGGYREVRIESIGIVNGSDSKDQTYGIKISDSDNLKIFNVQVFGFDIGIYGEYQHYVQTSIFEGLIVVQCNIGIYFNGLSSTIDKSYIYLNKRNIQIVGNNNTIRNTNVEHGEGIYAEHCDSLIISQCAWECGDETDLDGNPCSYIVLDSCKGVSITDVRIATCPSGISIIKNKNGGNNIYLRNVSFVYSANNILNSVFIDFVTVVRVCIIGGTIDKIATAIKLNNIFESAIINVGFSNVTTLIDKGANVNFGILLCLDGAYLPLLSSAVKDNATILPINVSRSGSARPSGDRVYIGYEFFDTSLSPARPIYWNGTAWVDATGTPI